ncbi:hypothetical protein CHH57_01815 [Niallia circulans]|uniref:Uncharacterized protein n=1 Tax=Niallia circulans TaxID=1397 RepID=A0AA91Z2G4_NIACI|nr:superinfection exclusion B family protein [Niallia circulans]PAD85072.1 hypothetical protein CHH57_01815 [Niallia circulans]
MKIDFKITELLTLPASIMAAICLASGTLLFSPVSFIEKLYMLAFREKYGFIIGVVFLISLCILIVNIAYTTLNYIATSRAEKRFFANAGKKLRKLSTYQKAIVYGLYQEENRTHVLPLHDGAVRELEHNQIIGKVSSQYMVPNLNNAMIPYMVQPWVIDELDKDQDLLTDYQNAFNKMDNDEGNGNSF